MKLRISSKQTFVCYERIKKIKKRSCHLPQQSTIKQIIMLNQNNPFCSSQTDHKKSHGSQKYHSLIILECMIFKIQYLPSYKHFSLIILKCGWLLGLLKLCLESMVQWAWFDKDCIAVQKITLDLLCKQVQNSMEQYFYVKQDF